MRYITSNAENRIPVETQLMMWYLFDAVNEEKNHTVEEERKRLYSDI